ncbi:unnamed protein product [Cochlearia groenlandica]
MDISDSSVKQQSEDLKIDILECENTREEFQENHEEEEEVLSQASSSSFGDSMCPREDDDDDGDGVEEAQSMMLSRDYPLLETCDDGIEFCGIRKKKLTDNWRRFVQPLMWRCKWIELKVKEIESRAKLYEKEVNSYYETKEFDLEKSKSIGFEGKSVPFFDQTQQRTRLYKRGRRKRVEEETTTQDVSAYMSNHNLFSYADIVTGQKCISKEAELEEDDCIASELNCSDDLLAKLLCKIDEAQVKAKGLKNRVDLLIFESEASPPHTSTMPRTMARCKQDSNAVENGKQCGLVEEPLTQILRESTVQIGRQRISADHTEDVLASIPQEPIPTQAGVECLSNNNNNNNSPVSYGGSRFHTLLEDLLMDEPEMNGEETEGDQEKLDYFRKLMNEITGVSASEEADTDDEEEEEEEEDTTPVAKKRKTSC